MTRNGLAGVLLLAPSEVNYTLATTLYEDIVQDAMVYSGQDTTRGSGGSITSTSFAATTVDTGMKEGSTTTVDTCMSTLATSVKEGSAVITKEGFANSVFPIDKFQLLHALHNLALLQEDHNPDV